MHTGETKNVLALTSILSLHIRMYQHSILLTERHKLGVIRVGENYFLASSERGKICHQLKPVVS